MSTQGRRKNTSVTRNLIENPYEFQFLQAVRLLERSAVFEKTASSTSPINVNAVAGFVPPGSEVIRFTSNQSLAFLSSQVQQIKRLNKNNNRDQWLMMVNFMGLTGSSGVLPFHYTELVLNRQKLKDETLVHFFDLFNHRTLSLFYQASVKYNLALQYERSQLSKSSYRPKDRQTDSLLSLLGLGTRGLNKRLYTRDESLIRYSGLWSQKVRNVSNLIQILESHFEIPVKIEQFIGQWEDLLEELRTRLGSFANRSGCQANLGRNVILGSKGWFAQGKIRIILGPLNRQQLSMFSPGTKALKALDEIVKLYVGLEINYEFIIRISKTDIPDKIQLNRKQPPIIGWNCWLSSKSSGRYKNTETVDISVSTNRLN